MISKINGSCYVDLIYSGIKNLERHRKILNDLNVFPVPDGDTGTNMVMTLRHGFEAIKNQEKTLSEIAQRFSSAAVFGARGNSGVIVSQFFKGLSDAFVGIDIADCEVFARALQNGYKYAYASVSEPVEGTILTVLRDASLAVTSALPLNSVNDAIDIFLEEARSSLAHTPELLPILKKASVVDSGGSGIVYFFEGIKKYLSGEAIDSAEEATVTEQVDLSMFNKDTDFHYGYCVEGVLQLTVDEPTFDHELFRNELSHRGNSVVTSLEKDKIKLHVHTRKLGGLMEYIQQYGELLTVKIENMSVQNAQSAKEQKQPQKFLYSTDREPSRYATVAVATNEYMQNRFFEMGADVVILSEIAPSSQDFIDAFDLTAAKNILVFPNSANSILPAKQAGEMYSKAAVTVLNSRSVAECYATLSILDFSSAVDEAISLAASTISRLYRFSIYHAVKDVKFGSRIIDKNAFFALASNKLLDVKSTLDSVAINTIDSVLSDQSYELVTLFYGKSISDEAIERLIRKLNELGHDTEFATVSTGETVYDITVTFE